MRADQWSGLVTKASPYILPAGAAVEQVNLQTAIPGQLTTRGGMRKVSFTISQEDILSCFPYSLNGQTTLIVMTTTGVLIGLPSPSYGPEVSLPVEPAITVTSSQTGATYTNRFVQGAATETPANPVAVPAKNLLLTGGSASTAAWPFYLPGGEQPPEEAPETYYDGGVASTAAWPTFPIALPDL